jgi:methylmalonyl-CoA/ethylmalonyl-CoA epimerase
MSSGGADPGMILRSVDHIGIAVPDLRAAIEFYTSVLGLRLVRREDNSDHQVSEAMLAPADPGAAAIIQLVAPLNQQSPLSRFLDRTGPGVQHVAFRVSDVEHAAAEYRRRGLRLLYDSPKPGTRGSRINFVHPKDTGGVLLELVEAAEEPTQG